MIQKVEMISYVCDGCGERFRNENDCIGYFNADIWDEAESSGWIDIDGKQYCPNCYEYDEESDKYIPKAKEAEE